VFVTKRPAVLKEESALIAAERLRIQRQGVLQALQRVDEEESDAAEDECRDGVALPVHLALRDGAARR
jgi:hypothetical protein